MDKGTNRIEHRRRDVVERLDEQVERITAERPDAAFDELRLLLQQELLPLVDAREAILGPAVERSEGAPGEASTFALDCEVIRRYIDDIIEIVYLWETGAVAADRSRLEAALVKKTIGLQALAGLYFEKESRVYFPLIERVLPAAERERVVRDLETGNRVIRLPDSESV